MERLHKKKQQDNSLEELFGNVLQQFRKKIGLSQEELGLESGYHRTYISLLERGKKSPSLKTIFRLAKALHVKPSEILERIHKTDQIDKP